MKTKCVLTEDEIYELAYYHIAFFRYWEGKSTTWVDSNEDHSVYRYARTLPGLYKEIVMFEITGEYARQLWALECYLNSLDRLKENRKKNESNTPQRR